MNFEVENSYEDPDRKKTRERKKYSRDDKKKFHQMEAHMNQRKKFAELASKMGKPFAASTGVKWVQDARDRVHARNRVQELLQQDIPNPQQRF